MLSRPQNVYSFLFFHKSTGNLNDTAPVIPVTSVQIPVQDINKIENLGEPNVLSIPYPPVVSDSKYKMTSVINSTKIPVVDPALSIIPNSNDNNDTETPAATDTGKAPADIVSESTYCTETLFDKQIEDPDEKKISSYNTSSGTSDVDSNTETPVISVIKQNPVESAPKASSSAEILGCITKLKPNLDQHTEEVQPATITIYETVKGTANVFSMVSKERLVTMNHDILKRVVASLDLTNKLATKRTCLLDFILDNDPSLTTISYDLISEICGKLDKAAVASHLEFFGLEPFKKATKKNVSLLKQHLSFASVPNNNKKKRKTKLVLFTNNNKYNNFILKSPPKVQLSKGSKSTELLENPNKRGQAKTKKSSSVDKSTNTCEKDPTLRDLTTAVMTLEQNICEIKDNLNKENIGDQINNSVLCPHVGNSDPNIANSLKDVKNMMHNLCNRVVNIEQNIESQAVSLTAISEQLKQYQEQNLSKRI